MVGKFSDRWHTTFLSYGIWKGLYLRYSSRKNGPSVSDRRGCYLPEKGGTVLDSAHYHFSKTLARFSCVEDLNTTTKPPRRKEKVDPGITQIHQMTFACFFSKQRNLLLLNTRTPFLFSITPTFRGFPQILRFHPPYDRTEWQISVDIRSSCLVSSKFTCLA